MEMQKLTLTDPAPCLPDTGSVPDFSVCSMAFVPCWSVCLAWSIFAIVVLSFEMIVFGLECLSGYVVCVARCAW